MYFYLKPYPFNRLMLVVTTDFQAWGGSTVSPANRSINVGLQENITIFCVRGVQGLTCTLRAEQVF